MIRPVAYRPWKAEQISPVWYYGVMWILLVTIIVMLVVLGGNQRILNRKLNDIHRHLGISQEPKTTSPKARNQDR